MQKTKSKGFTLIEILVVIGLIAILAAIVLIAINPARQFAQARNSQRESDTSTLLNAIGQNVADNKGIFTCAGVTIPTAAAGAIGAAAGNVNLASCLVPTYIATGLPKDPGGTVGGVSKAVGTDNDTGYTVQANAAGRITVCAPNHAEDTIGGATAYCQTR